jgi:hypothetical protein
MKNINYIPTDKKAMLKAMCRWTEQNICPIFVFNQSGNSEPYLQALVEMAKERNLVKFAGNCLWFEYVIAPLELGGDCEAVKADLNKCLHKARRHKNHFYGFVTLDVSERAASFGSKHFGGLLKDLLRMPGTFFGLVLYSGDKNVVDRLEQALSKEIGEPVVYYAPEWEEQTAKNRAIGFAADIAR